MIEKWRLNGTNYDL